MSYKGGDSTTTEEERHHLIKVLEHECKVYHFEKNVIGSVMESQEIKEKSFDQYSEQKRVNSPQNYQEQSRRRYG